jgi:hypothetical protein
VIANELQYAKILPAVVESSITKLVDFLYNLCIIRCMGNQTDYFQRIGYKAKYQIGDRVFGHWNKIPFVGTVGNDRVIDKTGPQVTIHLDLPIKHEQQVRNVIVVRHRDITKLTQM